MKFIRCVIIGMLAALTCQDAFAACNVHTVFGTCTQFTSTIRPGEPAYYCIVMGDASISCPSGQSMISDTISPPCNALTVNQACTHTITCCRLPNLSESVSHEDIGAIIDSLLSK